MGLWQSEYEAMLAKHGRNAVDIIKVATKKELLRDLTREESEG